MRKVLIAVLLLGCEDFRVETVLPQANTAENAKEENPMTDRLKPNGIVDGRLVKSSPAGQSIRTLSLVLAKNGVRTAVADQSIAVTANASGNPRIDMVQWDGKSITVIAGTAAAAPECPVPDSGNVPIAVLYLPDGYTEIHNLGDPSDVGIFIAYYYAASGLHAYRTGASQDDISSATYVDVDNMYLSVYFPKAGMGYEYELHALVCNAYASEVEGALTMKCNGDLSGASVEMWCNMPAKGTYSGMRSVLCRYLYNATEITPGVLYPIIGRAKKTNGTNVLSILGRSITIRQRN